MAEYIRMEDVAGNVASFNQNSEAARARRLAERKRILAECGLPEDIALDQTADLRRLLDGGSVAF